MRLFKFVKWSWHDADPVDRDLTILLLPIIPCLISAIWIGIYGLIIYALITLGTVVVIIFYGLYRVVLDKWKRFEHDIPTDDVVIMEKLKGIYRPPQP